MRKMRVVAAAIAAMAVLAACGGKKADFDVATLGNDLDTKITYEDELAPMELDFAGRCPPSGLL